VQAPYLRGALQKLVIDSNFKTVVDKFKEIAFHFLKVPVLYWGYVPAKTKGVVKKGVTRQRGLLGR
jgi:hypothetical protein